MTARRSGWADCYSSVQQRLFRFGNGVFAEVENGRCEHRVGATHGCTFDQMIEGSDTSAGDDRHIDSVSDSARESQVVPGFGAVAIHRGEQDFAGAQLHYLVGPLDGIDSSVLASTLHEDVPLVFADAFRIDSYDCTLAAEFVRYLGDEFWPLDRSRVDGHLVCTGAQQPPGIFDGTNAAADRERDIDLFGRAFGQFNNGVAIV